jgi:orotate phosphoribosyltransferase
MLLAKPAIESQERTLPSLARSEPAVSSVAADPRARLRDIIAARSFRFGQTFRLASGAESNVYFNMKPTMFDPEGAALMARLVVERLARDGIDAVGGLEMGAVPIVAAATVQSQLTGRPIRGFFVRKKAKEHGARLRIEGLAADESLKGKRIAVIDDVCTTGGSAIQAVDEVREAGGDVVLALAIVDREEGAAANFREHGLAFDALYRAREFIPEGFERANPDPARERPD